MQLKPSRSFFRVASVCVAGGLSILLMNAYVTLSAQPHMRTLEDLKSAQAVLILGARVYENGALSPMLKERVDTGIQVYKSGKAEKILVSGDNGTKAYNEVVPMRDYLLASGVPAEDIFLDYAGFDTYDSMYRARAVFEVGSAVVVTQQFHLPRAVFLADALGISVQGVSPQVEGGRLYNYLREVPARIKAIADVSFDSSPTYLGERIPITGDGRQTHSP